MIIYKITNLLNGKSYIGQTRQNVKARWYRHKNAWKKRWPSCIGLAIKKYGQKNFSITILDNAKNLDDLNTLETHYIRALNTMGPFGYNLTSGGDSRVLSVETRLKISKTLLGNIPWNKGIPLSKKQKQHLRLKNLGKVQSSFTIAKRASKLNKAVKCSNGNVFPSLKAAALFYGTTISAVCSVLKGRKKSTKGAYFCYNTKVAQKFAEKSEDK